MAYRFPASTTWTVLAPVPEQPPTAQHGAAPPVAGLLALPQLAPEPMVRLVFPTLPNLWVKINIQFPFWKVKCKMVMFFRDAWTMVTNLMWNAMPKIHVTAMVGSCDSYRHRWQRYSLM